MVGKQYNEPSYATTARPDSSDDQKNGNWLLQWKGHYVKDYVEIHG